MGILIAMAYPTEVLANLADHTYVKCGTGGKAWGCWGGKSGGHDLRQGAGGTKRADAIAKPDEKAGIKCYLINGVCHQAANRILLPAAITVSGARGYTISEALFGTYGRIGLWPCTAPFDKYPTVTGDLPECIPAKTSRSVKATGTIVPSASDKLDWHYINGILQLYGEAARMLKSRAVTVPEARAFHLRLFMYMVEFHLGPMLDRTLTKHLRQIRSDVEKARLKIEKPFTAHEIEINEFAKAFDKITLDFQDEMAGAMTPEQYCTLFDLKPDERVVLADPNIISEINQAG